jgi:hypothetical protein
MEAVPSGKELFFRTPGDMFTCPEQEAAYNFTVAQARLLREQLDLLLRYVREHYIEINPAETGAEAVADYYSE